MMDDEAMDGAEQNSTATGRWYAVAGGQTFGPVGVNELRDWQREGRLPFGWQVCPEGGTEWVSPADIPALASVGVVAPPSPMAAMVAGEPDDEAAPEIGELLRGAWELFQQNALWSITIYAAQMLIALAVAALPALVFVIKPWSTWPTVPFDSRILVAVASYLICMAVVYPLGLGVAACYIDAARTGVGSWRMFWSGFSQWSSLGVMMTAWMFMTSLPGVGYAAILLTPALMGVYYTLGDQQRGIVHACTNLKELLTRRYWWALLVQLVSGLVGVAGALALGIGMIISVPVSIFMAALAYVHLANRMGWGDSTRETPQERRTAIEVLPVPALLLLLLVVDVVVYVWVF